MLLRRFAATDGGPLDDRYYAHPSIVDFTGGLSAASSEAAEKIATVYRALNVAAAGVALLPLDVFDDLGDQGKRRVTSEEEPLRGVLRRQPNRCQTSYRWRHHMVGRLLLTGNYYCHKVGRPGQPPEQLRPYDQTRWSMKDVTSSGELVYEYRQTNGNAVTLRQDDVLHVRGYSRDGYTGVSVFDLMRDHVSLALASRAARTAFMRNGMRPGVVLRHPGTLTPSGEANLQARYVRTHGGPTKAGLPLVLGEGADISTFEISAEDAQWIEGEHFQVEEFLRFIGIPGVLVGFADKTATYASAEMFFQSFVTHCLWPIAGNIEAELSLSLWGPDSDRKAEFNLDAMMRADSAARAAFYRTVVEMGIYTRNEVRRIENRNPLPGLDEPLTPANMRQPGAAAQPAALRPGRAPASRHAARLARRFARGNASRVVTRELLRLTGGEGQKGLAVRFAADPEGFRRAVADFYAGHAEMVAAEMHIPEDAAEAYCVEQRDAVLAHGIAVCQSWTQDRAAHLERLALGGAA